MDFNDVIKNRYSCKSFSDKEVEKDKLMKVLEAGRLAPTAKNLQPQKIYVIKDEKLKLIDKVTPCRYNAPLCLVVAFNKENVFTYPGGKRNSGIEDATIVATHMLLEATNQGLDSCWINFFNPDELKEVLMINDNEEILMILDLGYKNDDVKPLDNHYKRKKLEEIVTFM